MVHSLARILCLSLVASCSIIDIHYPDHRPRSAPLDCERLRLLPYLDAAAGAASIATSVSWAAEQARPSPWPVVAAVTAAWELASAGYGFYETSRCRSELATHE